MEWLQAVGDGWVAVALRRSSFAYMLVNTAHILAFGLLVGSIATLDLRLLGLFGRQPLGVLGPVLLRVAAAGLALAVATGVVLFTVRPLAYAENPAFLAKLGLILFGAANAGLQHLNGHWRSALEGGAVHPTVRAAAALSLATWAAAVLAGRWVGFL